MPSNVFFFFFNIMSSYQAQLLHCAVMAAVCPPPALFLKTSADGLQDKQDPEPFYSLLMGKL